MFGAVQFLDVLILTLLRVQYLSLVKVTELPPVMERAADSSYLLLAKICLSIFPFGV